MIQIVPYQAIGSLSLGVSKEPDCIESHGAPVLRRVRRESVELHFDNVIFRFDAESGVLFEATILPPTKVLIAGLVFDWSSKSLRMLSRLDEMPLLIHGFVVMKDLGIAITGVHDDDKSQRALTVFKAGAFDPLMNAATKFL